MQHLPLITCPVFPCFIPQVCQAWFARVGPLLLRAAAAAQLHELAVYHALQRLRDLQQHTQALLPAVTAAREDSSRDSSEGAEAAAASPTAQTPLAERQQQQQRVAASQTGGDASATANPATALLAATRGSPDIALRSRQQRQQQQPGSPAIGSHRSRQVTRQQLQQAAAKAAEAAAAAAAALVALADAEGVAGLQAYCQQAFQPLLQLLHQLQAGGGPDAAAAAAPGDADPAASAAAAAAWDWLVAVQLQAAGRYEEAVEQYSKLYTSPAASGMQCAPAGALARLVGEAYAAVGDAAGLQRWLQVRAEGWLPCRLLAE